MADLEQQFKTREAAKDDAIDTLTAGYGKLDDEVKKIADAYISGTIQATAGETSNLVKRMEKIKARRRGQGVKPRLPRPRGSERSGATEGRRNQNWRTNSTRIEQAGNGRPLG